MMGMNDIILYGFVFGRVNELEKIYQSLTYSISLIGRRRSLPHTETGILINFVI